MAELLGNGGAALLAVEGEGNEKQTVSRSGRSVGGGSSNGRQCQDGRGTWPAGQAAGDGWRHAAVVF